MIYSSDLGSALQEFFISIWERFFGRYFLSVSGNASTRSPVWGWGSWAVGAVYPFLLSLKGIIWMDEHGVLVLYEMRSDHHNAAFAVTTIRIA